MRWSVARAAALEAPGEVRGRVVMVHASLRAIGPVDGGATGVIEAVLAALRPNGTMVMMIAADDAEPFDRLATPANVDTVTLTHYARIPGRGSSEATSRASLRDGRCR